MNHDFLHDLLHRSPFEPFAVHLSNGEVHPVKHPEFANSTRTRLVVVDPVADRITIVSLLHIANVEMLKPAAA